MEEVVNKMNVIALVRRLELLAVIGLSLLLLLSRLPFPIDSVIVADLEEKLCSLVYQFGWVVTWRKLRLNAG